MKNITVYIEVQAPLETVWEYWNNPIHITHWAFASDTWECPHAENNLNVGEKFLTRMSAKDGSATFDLIGKYTTIVPNEKIEYTLEDGRDVSVVFSKVNEYVTGITETFEMENQNPEEMQRAGWQAILNNFKSYVEKENKHE